MSFFDLGFSDLLGAAGTLFGGQDANDTNRQISAANNATSIELANSAHTREVADLQNAGLNPMLSYFGHGAQVPNFSTPNIQNPVAPAVHAMNESKMASAQSAQLAAQTETAKTQASLNGSLADKANAEADNIRASTPNIPLQGANLSADTSLKTRQADAIQYTVSKTIADTNLTNTEQQLVTKNIANAVLEGRKISAETGNINVDSALKKADIVLKGYQTQNVGADTQLKGAETGVRNTENINMQLERPKLKAAAAVSEGVSSAADALGKIGEGIGSSYERLHGSLSNSANQVLDYAKKSISHPPVRRYSK